MHTPQQWKVTCLCSIILIWQILFYKTLLQKEILGPNATMMLAATDAAAVIWFYATPTVVTCARIVAKFPYNRCLRKLGILFGNFPITREFIIFTNVFLNICSRSLAFLRLIWRAYKLHSRKASSQQSTKQMSGKYSDL